MWTRIIFAVMTGSLLVLGLGACTDAETTPAPTPTTSESQIKNVQVPDVIGDKEAQAVQQLQQVGLEVTVVYEAAPAGTTLDAGTVLSASPAPGTNVRVGTTVVLKVVDPDKG